MTKLKLIIAGGGTGGHIFPAIAIANAVKRISSDAEILFVGAKGKMEMEKVPKEGYQIIGLDIAGFNRNALWKNIFLPFKLLKSFIQAGNILRSMKPHVVVGVGGYASFPMLYMAQRKGIHTLIQEQNSFAGKSNQILGKKADTICVAYDHMERFFPKEKIVLTGNPVRQNMMSSRQEGLEFFHLNSTKKTVFAFGGSLGAKSINEALLHQFKELIELDTQLIWQTGTTYFSKAKEAVKGFEDRVKVHEFIHEMGMAYAAADVILSRAGASSIAELCIVGKPTVFVPFPFASEDHQTYNALALVKKNAALLVKDVEAQDQLIPALKHLLNDTALQNTLIQHMKPLAVTDADHRIAHLLIQLAR